MPTPPEPVRPVTHMAIADPPAFRARGPQLSKHRAPNRERQRNKQSHDGSGNPTVFGRRIPAPKQPGKHDRGEAAEQRKWHVLGHINVGPVLPERARYAPNWNAVFSCDLLKQRSHAPVPLCPVRLTRVRSSLTKMDVG